MVVSDFLNFLSCRRGLQVTKKLEFHTPDQKFVNEYLREIAKGYGIIWTPPEEDVPVDTSNSPPGGGEGGAKVRKIDVPSTLLL